MLLKAIEARVDKAKINEFKKSLDKPEWDGPIEDKSLFHLWKTVFAEIQDKEKAHSQAEQHTTPEISLEIQNSRNEDNQQIEQQNEVEIVREEAIEDSNKIHQRESQLRTEPVDTSVPSTSKNTEYESSPPEKQDKAQSNLPINVPSPFKGAIFWPDTVNNPKKRKMKEKIPSVVTSQAWQEYHRRKEMEKRKKIEEKEKRIRIRVSKRIEKLKAKSKDTDSESSADEWIESGDSLDDVSIFGRNTEEMCEMESPNKLAVGDYLLVKFIGGKRMATNYRYVCVIQKIYGNNEIEVMSMRVLNEEKTLFRIEESDISCISKSAVLGKLPEPIIISLGDRIKYQFEKPVNVLET